MKKDNQTFATLCRQDTGRHFLDSGGAYGRHYEKPPIDPDDSPFEIEAWGPGTGKIEDRSVDITCSMETSVFLADQFEILHGLTDAFEAWAEEQDHGDWFSLVPEFMSQWKRHIVHTDLEDIEHPDGFTSRARDNVYNGENDLTQVFIWEVFCPVEHREKEWYYHPDAVTAIWIHTGCDVRGGYTRPVFCRMQKNEGALPLSFCVQWYIGEGTDADGDPLSDDECRVLDEKWSCGYTSWPTGQFRGDVKRVVSMEKDKIAVLLNSGETVTVYPAVPW